MEAIPRFPAIACCGLILAGLYGGMPRATAADSGDRSLPAPIVTTIAISPSGTTFATAGDDHRIRVWDLGTSRLLQTLYRHEDWVTALTFSADGTRLYSAAADGRILEWDLRSGSASQAIRYQREPYTSLCRLGSTGSLLAIGFRCPLQMVDPSRSGLASEFDCPCDDMRVVIASPDGGQFAAGGRNGRIRIWAQADGRILHDIQAHDQRLRALSYTPDGRRLVSAGEDRAICVWDTVSGEEVAHLNRSEGKILCVATLDATRLATGTSENVIDLWDMTTGEHHGSLAGHTGSVCALAYSNHRLLSAAFDATVRCWDVTPGAAAVALRVIDVPKASVHRR